MGRKTLQSLPGGKPLPGRRNIVISRNKTLVVPGVEFVSSVDGLLEITKNETVYVIGGEQIYRLLLPYCEKAYITKIAGVYETDTFFPDLDSNCNWRVDSAYEPITSENDITYRIYLYVNHSPKHI